MNDVLFIDVDILKILIMKIPYNLLARITQLSGNTTEVFDSLIRSEKSPELSLREDSSAVSCFLKMCFTQIYNMDSLDNISSLEEITKVSFHEDICKMCYYLDRTMIGNSRSHIIAVTGIITMKLVCPKLLRISIPLTRDVMKLSGLSSINESDMPYDTSVIIKNEKGKIHICEECGKWVCDECRNPLKLDLSKLRLKKVASDSESDTLSHSSTSSNTEPVKSFFSRNSPVSFSPRNLFKSKDSPHDDLKRSYIIDMNKRLTPRDITLYDDFCRSIIYKGYTAQCSFRKLISIMRDDEIELDKLWIYFMEEEDLYIKYGLFLKDLYRLTRMIPNDDLLIYWDNLLDEQEKAIIYKLRNKKKVRKSFAKERRSIVVGWRRCYRKLLY